MNINKKIGFIGAGKVGTALAESLSRHGVNISAINSRTYQSSINFNKRIPSAKICDKIQDVVLSADIIFITTPDGEIEGVANNIAHGNGKYLLHCSGAHSVDVLKNVENQGAKVGSFHPMQSFATIEQGIENLPGTTFGIEAEDELLEMLKIMAELLDGTFVLLKKGDKELYHASGVMVCNYFVTLIKIAADIWSKFGKTPDETIKSLMPIIKGTVKNIENIGLPNALTGPIARGDLKTIEKHLDSLNDYSDEILRIYKALGLETVNIALAKKTLNSNVARKMTDILG